MKFTFDISVLISCMSRIVVKRPAWHAAVIVASSALLLAACGGGGGGDSASPAPESANGPAWFGYARDSQHSANAGVAAQPLRRILWQTPIDLAPQYNGSALLAHYGSPIITARNTIVIPVKTAADGSFRLEAKEAKTGTLVWSANTDYRMPPHNWLPSYNLALTQDNRVYAPGSGGKIYYRDNADSASGAMQTLVFYGANAYAAAAATFDASVFINTPLTIDSAGNLFFGFPVTGTNPADLGSGIARIAPNGSAVWVSAKVAAGDNSVDKVALNAAPALSPDSQTLYVAVNTAPAAGVTQSGYLLALNSTTLATKAKVLLTDPATNTHAWINDNATSSPSVGSDGDVYYGVQEANFPSHNGRGWLLHFDAALSQAKTPGSFGWDITASSVPAAAVAAYTGGSTYLLMTKYNDYYGLGTGTGQNRVAILDPNNSQVDAISGIPVMAEILTALGPTADTWSGGVREWCINTAAVDPFTKSVMVNNEDGVLYRWDLTTNTFSEQIRLTSGIGEAYTPTLIGPDGAVYAINNAILFAIGR